MTYFEDVRAFHKRFKFPAPNSQEWLHAEVWAMRLRLILEELAETAKAYALFDPAGFADGLADLVYVVLGSAVEAGIPFDEVWKEVQRANMAKVGGEKDRSGKLLKPDGWEPPDIDSILRKKMDNETAGET